MAEELYFENLTRVLMDFGTEVREAYKHNLANDTPYHHIASGNLVNSLRVRVDQNGKRFEVVLTLADYWKWVEEDTAPHFPPLSVLREWIEVKPVLPRPDGKGRIPTTSQLAFLIGRKIAREGTTGTHDLSRAVADVTARFSADIKEAMHKDLIVWLASQPLHEFKRWTAAVL